MDDEEAQCRFCFEEATADNPLITPCKCGGSVKYLHLSCLRNWQRMVVVDQHTHPAFYEDDKRHHVCNICKSEYTCPPPTREELMRSFTGAEIASLIATNRIIGSHAIFSETLNREITTAAENEIVHPGLRSYVHWIRGAYLITEVDADTGFQDIELESTHLGILRTLQDEIRSEGRTYRLDIPPPPTPQNLPQDSSTPPPPPLSREERLRLRTSANGKVLIRYVSTDGPSTGDDHILAVNLARPLASLDSLMKSHVTACYHKAKRKRPAFQFDDIQLTHYSGGPCDDETIRCCFVLGGNGKGWTMVKTLSLALLLAAQRCSSAEGLFSGATVKVQDLVARQDLNGELGVVLKYNEELGRWNVRLRNGLGVQIKPSNLLPHDNSARGTVMAFWGDARWSRAQLLGEIARGHWGLCKASITDLLSQGVWRGLDGRLVFAPVTAMTDQQMIRSRQEMDAMRQHFVAGEGDDEEGEEDPADEVNTSIEDD